MAHRLIGPSSPGVGMGHSGAGSLEVTFDGGQHNPQCAG